MGESVLGLPLALRVADHGRLNAMANEKRKRLNLEMTPPVQEALDALKDQTGASSYVDVIRRALAIYKHLAEETQQDRRVFTRPRQGDDRTEREIVFF